MQPIRNQSVSHGMSGGKPCVQRWSVMRCRLGGRLRTHKLVPNKLLQSQDRWVRTSLGHLAFLFMVFVLLSLLLHRKTRFLSQLSLCRWELSAVISKTSLTARTQHSEGGMLWDSRLIHWNGYQRGLIGSTECMSVPGKIPVACRAKPDAVSAGASASARACSRPRDAYYWWDASTNIKENSDLCTNKTENVSKHYELHLILTGS